uniref:Uncharacterized protein n=1 Tax=Arundo donax TaxID=35708 RepID=A0A0A8XNL3_ARUDO
MKTLYFFAPLLLKDHTLLEHSGHKRQPLDLHFVQGSRLSVLASAPSDLYRSSSKPRLSIPPFLTEPTPLHCGQATIRRSPHLLHIPSDLLWLEAMKPSTLGAAMVAPSSSAPTTKPAMSLPVSPSTQLSSCCSSR